MTSGGYSEQYRHILLHNGQAERHGEDLTAGRPSAVLERNKKLSAETNKRRKQLEERWRQHEEAEERRRAEVLLARKARLRVATEKYQKSGLPQSARSPASARQHHHSRSSSLPFQLDSSSPRRAGSALDAATAVERALQAIRSEIQPTLRRAPPQPPGLPAGGGDALQHRLFSAANGSGNVGSSERHGGSWSNVAGVSDGRIGSRSTIGSAASATHYAGVAKAAGATVRDATASIPDRKMMAETWDGSAAGQCQSGGKGSNSISSHLSANTDVRDCYDKETPVRWASAAGQQHDWTGFTSAYGTHLQNGYTSQQQQQQHQVGGRPALKSASSSTAAVGRQTTSVGGHHNDDGSSDKPLAYPSEGGSNRSLSFGDSVDLARASIDSLDEETPDQVAPRPIAASTATSSPAGQWVRGDKTSGTVATAAAAASAGGPSRGFSTWRAAEEVASERSQNPHLRESPDAADESGRRNAVPTEGDKNSRYLTASSASVASGVPNAHYQPMSQQQQQQQQQRGIAVDAEFASQDVDELVQWQAVPSPPWARHSSSVPRRLSARTAATPLAAPSSHQSNAAGSSAAVVASVGGGGSGNSSSSMLSDQRPTYVVASDGRANAGDRSSTAQQQVFPQQSLHTGIVTGSRSSPNARIATAFIPTKPADESSATGAAGTTAAAVRLSSGRVLTVHSLVRSPSAAAPTGHVPSPEQTEFSPSSAWIPSTASTAAKTTATATDDYDRLWRGQPPLAVRPPGPGRPPQPQATAYGIVQLDRTAAVGTATTTDESVQSASYADVATAGAVFDSGSAYSDSTLSLSGRGSSACAVKGILKRSAAGSGRGGSSDNGSNGMHSTVADRGDLAGSKHRSLSSPNIRDSLDVTRKRNDVCPKSQAPRKKSVRFADSDSEGDEADTLSSAGERKSSSEKAATTACWISPAHVLDIQELQSLVAPVPQAPASSAAVQRPISASAAAQKPPAPPSARAQRAASASMAAAARRRGIPVAVRPPGVQRRWSSDGHSADGRDTSTEPSDATQAVAGNTRSEASVPDDTGGVSLGRTPTDEEINNLWHTVRSCLRAGQEATSSADLPATNGAPQSAPTAALGQARSPAQQASQVTKITADSLSRLGRTVNSYGNSGVSSLLLRGRAASDPALAVVLPQPHERQQHQQQPQQQQPQQQQLAVGGDVARIAERANLQSTQSSPYLRGPASTQQYNGSILSVKDGTASNGVFSTATYGSVEPSRQNGSVSSSMAAFLAAEELAVKPLVSESQIARAVREVEHFHRPAGMHPVPSRVAHFRRGSASKAAVPMSALSIEEQKLLRSLEVLNERLKITEAANAAAMGGTQSAAAVVPAPRR